MKRGTSSNARSQAKRTRERKRESQGSAAYMEAVRGTGCIVPRLGLVGGGTPCSGRMTFSHLDKANRPSHSWQRTVCMCWHHHLDEFELLPSKFCREYDLPLTVLAEEAERNVQQFGHLVTGA